MRQSLKTEWRSVAKLLANCAFIVPTLSGCIELQTPLSSEKFKDDQLVGFWQADDPQKSTMELKITSQANGDYQVQERDKGSQNLSTMVAFMTHGKRANYANVVMPQKDRGDAYMAVQYDVKGDKLRLWHVDFDKMKAALEAKTLEGKSNETTWGQNMFITTGGANVLKLFDRPDGSQYFQEELVFSRQQGSNNKSENSKTNSKHMNKQNIAQQSDSKSEGKTNECIAYSARIDPSNNPQVEDTLRAQADAWNAGDLDLFMTYYVKSPDITFVSADGEMKGYEALEARYRKKYGNSKETMGKLSFSDLQVKLLGEFNALCVGHWLVERPDHSKLQGMFSLILTKTNRSWKIIHDHTSLFSEPDSKKP